MEYNYKYKFTEIASQDINDVENYIINVLHNIDAAKNMIINIKNVIETVCKFPMLNKNCRCYGINDDNIRYIKVNNYNLYYYVDIKKQEVVFLRFLYLGKNIIKDDIK